MEAEANAGLGRRSRKPREERATPEMDLRWLEAEAWKIGANLVELLVTSNDTGGRKN